MASTSRPKVPIGVEGLDAMLRGGVPKGSVTLLRGGPGAGKTTLSLQFLLEGIKRGEKGLYVSLEESPEEILMNAEPYGWGLDKAVASGDLALRGIALTRVKDYLKADASDQNWLVTLEGGPDASGITGDFRADAVGTILGRLIKASGAKRLVFDSLTMFTAQFEHKVDLHMETLDLVRSIMREGCTTLLTAHQDPAGAQVISAEEYLPQGVINMHALHAAQRSLQAIQVLKMRGTDHDRDLRPYRIGEGGVTVYATESVLGGA